MNSKLNITGKEGKLRLTILSISVGSVGRTFSSSLKVEKASFDSLVSNLLLNTMHINLKTIVVSLSVVLFRSKEKQKVEKEKACLCLKMLLFLTCRTYLCMV